MFFRNILLCFGLLLPVLVSAQQRKTGPEQDCPGALPICDSIFTQKNSYTGWGQNHNELPPTGNCLTNNENNSVWYIFNTSSAGYLQMILSPLSDNDDYDFALFDITGHTCADIHDSIKGPPLEIRCNYTLNDTVDGNGLNTGFGHGGMGTSSAPAGPSFNDSVIVDNTPHTFVLLVNNFHSGGQGYTLDFRGSTTNITDTVKPKLIAISTSACDSPTSIITIQLSRPIQCDSIVANGSQFNLTGPAPSNAQIVIDSAYDTACLKGIFSIYVNIRLKNPITVKGNYTLSIHESTLGAHLVDLCDHEVDDTTIIYTQLPILKPGFTWDSIAACEVDTTTFANLVTPNDSTYLWEFGGGLANSTDTTPPKQIYPAIGNYNVTLVSYSGTCVDSITHTIHVGSSFYDFVFSADSVCQGSPVQFRDSVAGGLSTRFYYDFGDGALLTNDNPTPANPLDPTHIYTSPGSYTVKVIVTQSPVNSPCVDTAMKVIIVDSLDKANFVINPQTVCQGTPISFTDASSGAPTAWLWKFGTGDSSTKENVSYTYDSIGTFNISFQVSNVCNTTDTGLSITVKKVPVFSLGPDTSICKPDSVLLIAFPGADTIMWSTGDTTESIFFKNVPADVHVRVVKNGCPFETSRNIGEKQDSCIEFLVPTAFTPNGDGNDDYFRLVHPERIQGVDIKIYNRWGQVVYHGTTIDFRWDGTFNGDKAPVDVYTWFALVTGLSGQNEFFKGNITLLR